MSSSSSLLASIEATPSQFPSHDDTIKVNRDALPTSINRQSYSDQVVQYIKGAILKGELHRGEPIKESHLASKLGISISPVREAMQILVRERLISIVPQRGKYVSDLTPQEIYNAYSISGILHGAAIAESLPLWTQEDFDELAKIMDHILASSQDPDFDKLALDNIFHNKTLSRCSNADLIVFSNLNCKSISRFLFYQEWRTVFTTDEFIKRHQNILRAIQTRDEIAVEKVVRGHFRETGMRMSRFGRKD